MDGETEQNSNHYSNMSGHDKCEIFRADNLQKNLSEEQENKSLFS